MNRASTEGTTLELLSVPQEEQALLEGFNQARAQMAQSTARRATPGEAQQMSATQQQNQQQAQQVLANTGLGKAMLSLANSQQLRSLTLDANGSWLTSNNAGPQSAPAQGAPLDQARAGGFVQSQDGSLLRQNETWQQARHSAPQVQPHMSFQTWGPVLAGGPGNAAFHSETFLSSANPQQQQQQQQMTTETYMDVRSLASSLSTPQPQLQLHANNLGQAGRSMQAVTQQQQSAADHLLSQLVSAGNQSQARMKMNGGGPVSNNPSSNPLLLSNQLAAISLSQQAMQRPQSAMQHQSQPVDYLLDQQDSDALALFNGLSASGVGTMDMLSSGSITTLVNSGDAPSGGGGTSASLYVKNLSPDADELYLYQKFAPHGALLSCKVKSDPTTGKCRGVGFVNYVDQSSAIRAMQQLHGTRTAEGRQLHITLQAPRAIRAAAAAAAAANTASPRAEHPPQLVDMSGAAPVMFLAHPQLHLASRQGM